MGRRKSPEAKRRANERYRANVAARQHVEGANPTDTESAESSRPRRLTLLPTLITGVYDASHLRPTRSNPDPGLLAQPWQRWEHLLPTFPDHGMHRRSPASVIVTVHPSFTPRSRPGQRAA